MRHVFLAWLVVVVAGCGSERQIHDYNFLALGTLIKVSVYGEDEETAAAAVRIIETEFARLHDNYYPTRGELGLLNEALATGTGHAPTPELRMLLLRGAELERESGGLFNPGLGELFVLWGFVADEREVGLPPPDRDSIEKILARQPSMQELVFNEKGVGATTPMLIDLGGYAKGYALELAAKRLAGTGIRNALVNAGGDITALGQPGSRLWRIGIRDPDGSSVLAAIELHPGETVVTSGDYERFFEHQNQRFHHILDPRTGYPAGVTRSVSVVHTDPVLADAAATALFVAGPEGWIEIAVSMGLGLVMLVDDQHRIHVTRALADRVEITNGEYQVNIVDLQ